MNKPNRELPVRPTSKLGGSGIKLQLYGSDSQICYLANKFQRDDAIVCSQSGHFFKRGPINAYSG